MILKLKVCSGTLFYFVKILICKKGLKKDEVHDKICAGIRKMQPGVAESSSLSWLFILNNFGKMRV